MTTGRLFAVVGASGVGKDSLMRAASARLPDLHVVRRVITRPEAAGGEDFEGVSDAAFAARLARGDFVLHWQAHGLRYGIPATVASILAGGTDAMFNGSRHALTDAQATFPDLVILHVTASRQALADRLSKRGREDAADIARRLERAEIPLPKGLRNIVEIDNSGAFADTVAHFVDVLQPVSG